MLASLIVTRAHADTCAGRSSRKLVARVFPERSAEGAASARQNTSEIRRRLRGMGEEGSCSQQSSAASLMAAIGWVGIVRRFCTFDHFSALVALSTKAGW